MTELDILRESWRIHFYELLRSGNADKVNADVSITEIQTDDEEFENFVASLEDDSWEELP